MHIIMNVTKLTVLMADAHYMLCTYTNNSYYSIIGGTIALSSMLNLACFEMEVAFDILAVEVAG